MSASLNLPERLSDGAIVLDGHTMADAQAHWAGEDDEMLRRFEAPRRATLDEVRGAIGRWIDGRAQGGPMFTYALRTPKGELAGGCEVRWLATHALNVSYWLYPQFRGRGLAGRAMALLLDAVTAIPGAEQIEAHVDADNAASRHVAERAGFIARGTVVDDGAWSDSKIERVRYVRRIKLRPDVRGLELDGETRCAHWRSALDIIAIKMKCCGVYYACKDCHAALAGHATQVWPRGEWGEKAVLCGACGTELSIRQYLDCADTCPSCGAQFNPSCRNHHPFYFEAV
ncbi:MAG TPA: GNAT family N-acetyltransferase [Rhizomicrobium sp.]